MDALLTKLQRLGTGAHLVIATVFYGLCIGVMLPWQSARSAAFGEGMKTPDLQLVYAPSHMFDLAEAYGEAGRAMFIQTRFTVDLAWPLVYTYFNIAFYAVCAIRGFGADSPWVRRGIFVALLPFAFDLLENTANTIVMASYPHRLELFAYLGAAFTPVKWTTLGMASLMQLVALVAAAVALVKSRSVASA